MDNRDGIDFILTPQERDLSALTAIALEDQRRRRNQADKSREQQAAECGDECELGRLVAADETGLPMSEYQQLLAAMPLPEGLQ